MRKGLGYHNRRSAFGFSPGTLFVNGEQGAWYDPSDLTTLFQDSAGTTPVTAVEQPVGLVLDKSKGLVLGPELVTNGDFSSATGWVLSAGASISSGVLTFSSVASTLGATQANYSTLATNDTAKVVIVVTALTAGQFRVKLNGGSFVLVPASVGTHTLYVVAGSAPAGGLELVAAGTTSGTVDSISVQKLPGNHAYQTTSASRPTLRARYNLLTYSEQFDNAYWTKNALNTTGTPPWVNVAVAPDGTTTADFLLPTTANATHNVTVNAVATNTVGTVYTLSAYVKANGYNFAGLFIVGGGVDNMVCFNLSTGQAGATYGNPSYSITSVGNGWYRCSVTSETTTTTAAIAVRLAPLSTNTNSNFYTGDGTSGIFIWGAQLTQTAVFPSNTYQRIAAATDYATGAAFPPYLFFDGVDDSLLTNSVDFATVTSDGQARRNLLLNPTQFDVTSSWTATNATVTANQEIAPDGTLSVDRVVFTTGTKRLLNTTPAAQTVGTAITLSIYARGNVGGEQIRIFDGWVTTTPITLTTVLTRYSVTVSAQGTSNQYYVDCLTDSATIFIWGAQLETGSTATAFQNIGTDKMTVWAGVTKQSDATAQVIVELSAIADTNNGAFWIRREYQYLVRSGGGTNGSYTDVVTAPSTNVITLISDFAAPLTRTRVNGVSGNTSASPGGGGNFGNYPLYIGRRNNATLPLNGNIYSLIIRGAQSTAAQISSTESWVAAKTPLGSL